MRGKEEPGLWGVFPRTETSLRVAETPRYGPDVWVEEKPVFFRKPGRSVLAPAREKMLGTHLDSENLLWAPNATVACKLSAQSLADFLQGTVQSGMTCTKKSVLLEAPVELTRVLPTQRPQAQLWHGAVETHYSLSLVPPNPECQAAICTPTSAHRGCQRQMVGRG